MSTSRETESHHTYETISEGGYETTGGIAYVNMSVKENVNENEPPPTISDGMYESPGGNAYMNVNENVNEPPPTYNALSMNEYMNENVKEKKAKEYDNKNESEHPSKLIPMKPCRSVYWYAAGLSLAVAAVVGIVIGVTLYLLATSDGGGDGGEEGGGDGWGEWGAWGACDVTCGGGWMSRSRECLQDTCIGSPTQVQECAKEPCPAPELPVWSGWGAWSDCSVTCGAGTKTRSRTCVGPVDGCSGDATHTRACPGWSCPDCSQPCTGQWNASCTWCACAGDLTGQVLTSQSTPLANVTVSPEHAPYVKLAVTDPQGGFSVSDVCVGQMLLFSHPPRYLDTYAEVTSVAVPMQITMQDVVALSITTPPEGAVRLVGESVTLCCTATGSPPPVYYEWFHGSEVILTDVTAGQSVLVLQDLQEAQAGDYRCRANNDYSTIYSDFATLQVKVSDEASCPSSPLPHMKQLPYGCKTAGGALAMDVGTCSRDPCRAAGQNSSSTCERGAGDNFCCAPVEFVSVELVCEEYPDFISQVVRCGCVLCADNNQVVSGQVLAADTLAPVPYAHVQLHEGPSVFANTQGRFVLSLPGHRHRIALIVSDYGSGGSGDLVQTNKVLYAGNFGSESGVIIKLQRKAAPVAVNTSEETFLPMGVSVFGMGAGAFAGISIPPGSVFNDSGVVFTGEAVARLTTIDPRQLGDIENAPSDLSYVDEEGNEQMLDTFGMFYLQMQDPDGNPLHVQGDIEVSLDAELAGEVLPNLYTLQDDGKWHEESSMHAEKVTKKSVKSKYFKSSVVVGGITVPVTDRWINLDHRSPTDSCVSKVRLYENNAYMKPIDGARPYVVIIRSSIFQRYSQVMHQGPGSGYCIVHPCDVTSDSGTRGYVLIENQGDRAFPVSDDNIDGNGIKDAQVKARINARSVGDAIYTDMSFLNQQSSQGPFYRYSWDTSAACRDAGETDNHFRFHMEELSAVCGETDDYKRQEFPELGIVTDLNYYAWYTRGLVPSVRSHSAVYIKVIASGPFDVVLEATSMVGNNTKGSVKIGYPYGSLYQCTENVPAVCLELKPSGDVSDGMFREFFRDDTFIRVQTESDSRHLCSGYAISPELNAYVNHPTPDFVNSHKFELGLSERFEGHKTKLFAQGVYWYEGDSTDDLATVKQRAYDACRTGVDPNSDDVTGGPTNTDNYALKFFCP